MSPFCLAEVVSLLGPGRAGVFVDCTVGLGGHARALLEGGATRLIGLDRDVRALDAPASGCSAWADRIELVHADYRDLAAVLDARGLDEVDGVLADLGVSSMQLDEPGRGFSFRRDEPLDMRMDQTEGATAAEWLRDATEQELADVIYQFGEERFSRRIARRIVEARRERPIAPPASSPASSGARCRARLASASTRRRGRSRRCGSGSTASSRGSIVSRDAPHRACASAPDSPSSRFTRSRIGSSSTRSGAGRRRRRRPPRSSRGGRSARRRGDRAKPACAQRQAARRREAGMNVRRFRIRDRQDVRNNPIVREVDRAASSRAVALGVHRVRAARRRAVLGLAALPADALRLPAGEDAPGEGGRGADRAAPAPRGRDALGAEAHRRHRHATARTGGAVAGAGDRDRAGDDGRAAAGAAVVASR